jgi:hypothetical protein
MEQGISTIFETGKLFEIKYNDRFSYLQECGEGFCKHPDEDEITKDTFLILYEKSFDSPVEDISLLDTMGHFVTVFNISPTDDYNTIKSPSGLNPLTDERQGVFKELDISIKLLGYFPIRNCTKLPLFVRSCEFFPAVNKHRWLVWHTFYEVAVQKYKNAKEILQIPMYFHSVVHCASFWWKYNLTLESCNDRFIKKIFKELFPSQDVQYRGPLNERWNQHQPNIFNDIYASTKNGYGAIDMCLNDFWTILNNSDFVIKKGSVKRQLLILINKLNIIDESYNCFSSQEVHVLYEIIVPMLESLGMFKLAFLLPRRLNASRFLD